ncbi:DUF1398 family protein [Chryseobacterium sp.]|uniref:DUF1398 domain-containing protein n=1 Tax=Chryseobacterium sp. TaxID=1871047 RepID=UPI001B27C9FB|nr:DUF1398 family protein [Chryseobacterium sp.]MBO9690577.1 DUF1398 family protein [Chryseobacterium sp.]
MNFTIENIEAAHQKVKTGADFPQYIQAIKALGVSHYKVYVPDGNTEYFSNENRSVQNGSKYDILKVSDIVSLENFKLRLKLHQQGETDYMTFCNDCAGNGIKGWTMDLTAMTCTYFDRNETNILTEQIPG